MMSEIDRDRCRQLRHEVFRTQGLSTRKPKKSLEELMKQPIPHPFIAEAIEELYIAMGKHAALHSTHEAYAVIQEEVDELWEEIKKRNPDRVAMRKELLQVAAMTFRMAIDLDM